MVAEISRADFQAAIERGLEATKGDLDGGLHPEQIEALRKIGREAALVGTNFSTGCPATQAGIVDPTNPEALPPGALNFAIGFDQGWMEATGLTIGNVAPTHLVVSDQ